MDRLTGIVQEEGKRSRLDYLLAFAHNSQSRLRYIIADINRIFQIRAMVITFHFLLAFASNLPIIYFLQPFPSDLNFFEKEAIWSRSFSCFKARQSVSKNSRVKTDA